MWSSHWSFCRIVGNRRRPPRQGGPNPQLTRKPARATLEPAGPVMRRLRAAELRGFGGALSHQYAEGYLFEPGRIAVDRALRLGLTPLKLSDQLALDDLARGGNGHRIDQLQALGPTHFGNALLHHQSALSRGQHDLTEVARPFRGFRGRCIALRMVLLPLTETPSPAKHQGYFDESLWGRPARSTHRNVNSPNPSGYPVSTRVGSVKNTDATLFEPVEGSAALI